MIQTNQPPSLNLLAFAGTGFQPRPGMDNAQLRALREFLGRPIGELAPEEFSLLGQRGEHVRELARRHDRLSVAEALRIDPETAKAVSENPGLNLQNFFVEDIHGRRSLHPVLRDHRRREVLFSRPDLKPDDLEGVSDGKVLTTLQKRRDVHPQQIVRMEQFFFDRLRVQFPPALAGSLARQCTHESCELMCLRGVHPEQMTQLYGNLESAVGADGAKQVPFLFLKSVQVMKERGDVSPELIGQMANAIGSAGRGARGGTIAAAIDTCLTGMRDPERDPGQILGFAEQVRTLPLEPADRLEVLTRLVKDPARKLPVRPESDGRRGPAENSPLSRDPGGAGTARGDRPGLPA